MSSKTRRGFVPGFRQPVLRVRLVLPAQQRFDFARIDQWLTAQFGIDSVPAPRVSGRAAAAAHVAVAAFAWRAMLLGASVLRAVRIPAFEPGCVLDVARSASDARLWEVDALVACPDLCAPKAITTAHEMAAQVVPWLNARAPEPAAFEKVFAPLHANFVARVQLPVTSGESTISMLRQVWERHFPFRSLDGGSYQVGWGARQLRIERGAFEFDSAIGARLAGDKQRAAQLLRDAGLPAGVHQRVQSEGEARRAAQALGWPVVVKPANLERGEGVTVDVRDEDTLLAAFRHAVEKGARGVLVEQQVTGVCHRVQVVDGAVLAVSRRMPKLVTGDGTRTVRALVDAANAAENAKAPWLRLKPFPLDALALECLARAGLSVDSVPASGQHAPLRPIQTSAWGGVVEDFSGTIHPDNVAIAQKAARLFGLWSAGIDIISPDITRPWHENGAILNEVNYSPLLGGKQTGQAVGKLLEQLLPERGRIPVEAVVGDEVAAWSLAAERQRALQAQGIACWIAGDTRTLRPDGQELAVAGSGLQARTLALLMDREVQAVVLVVASAGVMDTGLAVDTLSCVHAADGAQALESVRAWLARFVRPPVQAGAA